jgi:hypothetical protein
MLNLVSSATLTNVEEDRINYIAEHMREADVAEVWASNRMTPVEALDRSVLMSDWSKVLMIDGDILGILGMVVGQEPGRAGVPWFLGTHNVRKHAKTFLSISGPLLRLMHNCAPVLVNYVHADNVDALRYLERVGFEIEDEPEPIGAQGEMFYKFWKEYDPYSQESVGICVTQLQPL